MESVPSGTVQNNSEVTLTCTTDEANPTANIVWKREGQTVTASDVRTVNGEHNAQKRISVLTMTATRSLNLVVFQCSVDGTAIQKQYTLGVECKYEYNLHRQL